MPTYPFQAQFDNPLPTAHDNLHERMAKIEARMLPVEAIGAGNVSSFNGRTGAVSFVLGDLTPLGDARYLQLTNFNTVGDARYVLKTGDTMTGPFTVQSQHNALAGTTNSVLVNPTIAPPGAGSSNVQVFNITYAINAGGAQTGTVTGLFISATETALQGKTHQLIDAVTGGDTHLRLMGNGNLGVGSFVASTSFGTTSAGTFLMIASTAPTADPATSAFQQWSEAGQWNYRTSVANEGAGQTNRVHNRAAQVTGSGTDYTLTNATAHVVFTSSADIILPTAGTYMVQAFVSILGTTDADEVHAKLRNSTDATDIGAEKLATIPNTNGRVNFVLMEIVTVAATKTVQIFAHNATAARGTVESIRTNIKYIRLS